ncbi:MAG TPA: AAA family ATPase, partial [Chloroflexota bacterium]|nr:AAA family ATPase [Chloroflexota bacterium]
MTDSIVDRAGNREETPPSPPGVHAFLIADVRGYTHFTVQHGDEAAARLAARFAGIARDVVAAHGGEVIELRGDEALAVFDSSRQALPAAVAFQARLAEEAVHEPALRVGIGLDAGEAIPVEGGFRGAALNLAARLCSLAGPGEILASDTMIALARKLDGIAYRERGLVPFKGFDDPVRVMEVTAADSRPATEPETAPQVEELPIGGYLGSLPANPLVGRENELGRAIGVVETVQNGTGKLLLLLGEPGAGKTRLAQEITLQLRNRDFVIAAGRSYEPQQSVPFYPFVEALTALYGAAPPALQKQVPSRWAELARLLPALGLPVSETNAAQDEQRLYWAVTGFVDAIADDTPVAIMLDDLHWADAASLELLQHLARHTAGSRVLLLATYRDVEVNRGHPLETALRDLRREDLI